MRLESVQLDGLNLHRNIQLSQLVTLMDIKLEVLRCLFKQSSSMYVMMLPDSIPNRHTNAVIMDMCPKHRTFDSELTLRALFAYNLHLSRTGSMSTSEKGKDGSPEMSALRYHVGPWTNCLPQRPAAAD